jgi:hypothetical protein
VRYTRGSKVLGIDPGEYARVDRVDARENRITIERENGAQQTYDPRRLSGVSVYQEVQREFSQGDRVQFTAPSRELQVANRELGTIEQVNHPAISKSGWTRVAKFDSISASIRILTTDTQ